ncbi:sporulation protein [Kibdelosporangium phytohabitans]|uniref:Sporulation protein n=1 Tax=Kibdelosporangium phytohabitans TaxID=860235 RepID=A0A0N9I0G5_9PSEU|nr:sporulation protein [Kibdelosporangium phytohabitans]ALG07974.1 sporulation protein [Kibdelosporangium phytohabitans]MBE1471077.1 sporulation-control protein [Kibdelosporangium phytohabitans]
MFSKVLASLGQGGAKVDAQLLDRSVRPGGPLRGQVVLIGGQVDQEVDGLGVALLARVEQTDERGGVTLVDLPFQNVNLASNAVVRAGQQLTVPFEIHLPWETPITTVLGKHLSGMAVGLQTMLDLGGSMADPQDIDAVAIEPLPAQHRILDAFSRLGFQFRAGGLEKNKITGLDQQLPFFQEIRFAPSPAFAQAFFEVAVTFLATSSGMQVVLDVRKKVRVGKGSGLGPQGRAAMGAFPVDYARVGSVNWEQQIEGWLREAAKPRAIFD